MSAFDNFIREALKKQEDQNPETRARVYDAARHVLANTHSENPLLPADLVRRQGETLEKVIFAIEAQYQVAENLRAASKGQAQGSERAREIPQEPREPRSARRERAEILSAPESVFLPPPAAAGKRRSSRRLVALLFVSVLGLGGLSAYAYLPADFGAKIWSRTADFSKNAADALAAFFDSAQEESAPSVPDPWISVFDPVKDFGNVITPGGSLARLNDKGSPPYVLLSSLDTSPTSNIQIRIPHELAVKLRGQIVTVEILVRSAKAIAQKFALTCQFHEMGECGRKDMVATKDPVPYIIVLIMNNTPLDRNQDAYFDFNAGLSTRGRGLEIYSIRLRASS